MARKRKELTPVELEQRRKSRERIAAYLEEKKISRQGLANKLSISEGTIRNYLHGRSYMTFQIAQLFEFKTGIVHEYWLGLADYKTVNERETEAITMMGNKDAWNAVDETLVKQRKEDTERSILFSKCGFTYENLNFPPGQLEFANINDPSKAVKSYRLTSISMPLLSADFTEAELGEIISRLQGTLHDYIELECYRKEKQQSEMLIGPVV